MSFSSLSHAPVVIGPLSLSPWANFNRIWTSVLGYQAEDFKIIPGNTLMSTLSETVAMIAVYLVVIFGGREIMKSREPLKLNGLFKIHNLMLTALSGALLILFAEQLIPTLWRDGLYENICGTDGWTKQLAVLYYVSFFKSRSDLN
jgi:fatty acid elongase 3